MMRHLFFIIILFMIFSCNKHEGKQNVINIKVDNSEQVNFSSLFNEYEFIFPESKDSAWIGLYIQKIEKMQEKLFLYNETPTGSNILCFDTKGRFLFSIDKFGKGPGEYTSLKDFLLDKSQNLLVLDVIGNKYGQNEYMYFNLDGNYLYSKSREEIVGFTRSMIEYDHNLYIANINCTRKDICSDILFFDKQNLEVIKSFDCVDRFTATHTPLQSFYKTSDYLLFYGGNDTIYTISVETEAPSPAYFVDFGTQQKSYKKSLKGKTHNEILELSRKLFQSKEIRAVNHIFSNDKYLSINYSENKNVEPKYDLRYQTVFYDKKTNKTYNTTNIYFDIFNGVKNNRMEIIGCCEGYFYSLLNHPFTEDEIKEIEKSKFLSDETKKSLLKMDEESNPIIFLFK